ncbi:FG-GAP repeat-containing protein [Halomicrobium zhouii]|uniref:FG-GAP repeat-containing protein n=1 Tax=Halomicrobium zhouii TaxID=767519 RepID=A0A1I6LJI0_9EURY|nr:FG-GAP repeat protein [Halomicrobium zhouii]SFS03472.1 FG-GAP repeat-containing protein [Halomicrobium zhouii]
MVSRRAFLRSLGLAASATLAGCSRISLPGEGSTPDDGSRTPTTTPNTTLAPATTSQPTESATQTSTPASTEEPPSTVTAVGERSALTPTGGEDEMFFGTSVVLSDDVALVDVDGERIHVFETGDDGWHQTAVLAPSEEDRFAYYPTSMALSGTTAYVGAPATGDAGAVYVFERDGNGWHRRTRISPTDDESYEFGAAVACDGETLVVGAVRQPSTMLGFSGTVTVFEVSGTDWTRQTTFESDPDDISDLYGRRVALSGNTVLVGAPETSVNDESSAGATYVYESSSGAWVEAAVLTAPDVRYDGGFGQTLALDGDTAVVGAPGGDDDEAGVAYVFERASDEWRYLTRVSSLGQFDYDDGPSGVALRGDTMLVGDPGDSGSGRVNRFDRTEEGWQRTAALVPDDPGQKNDFGYSIALAESEALVGAPTGDEDRRGRGYLFSL